MNCDGQTLASDKSSVKIENSNHLLIPFSCQSKNDEIASISPRFYRYFVVSVGIVVVGVAVVVQCFVAQPKLKSQKYGRSRTLLLPAYLHAHTTRSISFLHALTHIQSLSLTHTHTHSLATKARFFHAALKLRKHTRFFFQSLAHPHYRPTPK